MAKKAAKKSPKAMSKKGMKKTKGGLIGMLSPATQAVEYSPRDPAISGNITGNTINGGTIPGNMISGNNTWTGKS